MASPAQVFNGVNWEDVSIPATSNHALRGKVDKNPNLAPRDKSIFITLTHFKDEERCAETISNIFAKASNPKNVYIGIVEHNENVKKPDCRDLYCQNAGAGKDRNNHLVNCPHYSQLEHLAVFSLGAKGPTVSRALARKLLGNQEFCMQVDSHSDFVRNWDTISIDEWNRIRNEFAVLSHQPADKMLIDDANLLTNVARTCHVEVNPAKLPMFSDPQLTKVRNLQEPLLMQGWSAAFSFAKCHLEETVPYDFFLPQIFQGEEFPRFARMWTRGYDVYTPTQNIVYHDYSQESSAGKWPDSGIQRKWSQERIKTLLQIPMPENPTTEKDYANLNLYGLGARRTLDQLMEFIGFDFQRHKSMPGTATCAGPEYVPYDSSISPLENLYTLEAVAAAEGSDKIDDSDIDPLPIMPLRTKPVFLPSSNIGIKNNYGAAKSSLPHNIVHPNEFTDKFARFKDKIPKSLAEDAYIAQEVLHKVEHNIAQRADGATISVKVLASLWVLGLVLWFVVFAAKRNSSSTEHSLRSRRKKLINGGKNM